MTCPEGNQSQLPDPNSAVFWQPLGLWPVLRKARAGCRSSRRLLWGWLGAVALCLLLAGTAMDLSFYLPFSSAEGSLYIYPPILLSELIVFGLGPEWALPPVFLASLLTCLGLGVSLGPALLVALVNPVGLAVLSVAYGALDLPIDLRSWRAWFSYLGVSTLATLLVSSGAFTLSAALGADTAHTFLIWEGWVLGAVLGNVCLVAPSLRLWARPWYEFRNRRFPPPRRTGVPFRVLAAIIGATGLVLAAFLVSASQAATSRLESVLQRRSAHGVESAVWDAVASWRLSAWCAIAMLVILTLAALAIAYWWSSTWEQQRRVLGEASGRARAALKVKGDFLAMVSHELRTPMNGILGMHELLLGGKIEGEARHYARIAEESAQHLLLLLNELLDLSKIENGNLEIERAPFDLRRQIHLAAALLGPKAEAAGLRFDLTLDEALPLWVVGDALRFRQILLNLAGNAVKFTGHGSVSVSARLAGRTEGQATVCITVADTGPGISEETLPRLFQPFSQGDASLSRSHGGTGLGLSISRELVERMGGSIGVESEVGKGSTFRFTLPFPVAEGGPELEAPETGTSMGASSAPILARVLVAEDNAVNQLVARRFLERLGCTVDVATTGVEAVMMCAACRYELVLMDCQMPEMDGLEATRRIREQETGARLRVPILAITAHAGDDWRERCLAAGMDDFLSKPISFDGLVKTIEPWLAPLARLSAQPPSSGPAQPAAFLK